MHHDSKQLSYAVESVSRALAEWTVVAHAELDPTLPERYGGSWRRDWLADVQARVHYLAQAVAVRAPAILAHMCRWSAAARSHDISWRDDLKTSLRCCGDVIGAQMPGKPGEVCTEYINEAIASLEQPLPERIQHPRTDLPHADLRLALLNAMLTMNRHEAVKLVTEALDNDLPIEDLYIDVLRVTLHDVGEMWHAGEISVGDEHFATETIRELMALTRTRFPQVPPRTPPIVASAASGDLHDVGLRMACDLLQLRGWPTTYLGANLPTADLILSLKEREAGVLALSISTCMHLRTGGETIEQVRAAMPNVRVIVGGYPFTLLPNLAEELGADACARGPDDAVRIIETWSN